MLADLQDTFSAHAAAAYGDGLLHVDTLALEPEPRAKPNAAQIAHERTDVIRRAVDLRQALTPRKPDMRKVRFTIETRDGYSGPWEVLTDGDGAKVELDMQDLVLFCNEFTPDDLACGVQWRAILVLDGVRMPTASVDIREAMPKSPGDPMPTLWSGHCRAHLPYQLHQLAERAAHVLGA